MNSSNLDNYKIGLFAHLQDEVSYIIECYLAGNDDEAFTETCALLENLKNFENIEDSYKNELCFSLEEVLADIRTTQNTKSAHSKLIIIRRLLYNKFLTELGHKDKYLFDDPSSL